MVWPRADPQSVLDTIKEIHAKTRGIDGLGARVSYLWRHSR